MKPLLFSEEISKAMIDASVKLKESAQSAYSEKTVAKIIAKSTNVVGTEGVITAQDDHSDEAIKEIIAKAMSAVGTEGIITIEDNYMDWAPFHP